LSQVLLFNRVAFIFALFLPFILINILLSLAVSRILERKFSNLLIRNVSHSVMVVQGALYRNVLVRMSISASMMKVRISRVAIRIDKVLKAATVETLFRFSLKMHSSSINWCWLNHNIILGVLSGVGYHPVNTARIFAFVVSLFVTCLN
jgi:hypothetical protein